MKRSEAVKTSRRAGAFPLLGALAFAFSFFLVLGSPAMSQQVNPQQNQQLEEPEEYEYETGEGLHEEEWYDPSDWFDVTESVNFESDDWWDFGYGYDEAYAGYDYGYGEGYGYGYGYGQDEFFGLSPAYDEESLEATDYYTEEWHQDEGIFEGWF